MNSALKQLNVLPGYYTYFAEIVLDRLREQRIPMRAHLLEVGDMCDSIYFIEQGAFIVYKKKGDNPRAFVSRLLSDGDICFLPEYFFKGTPSKDFIMAVEDSLIYYLTYDDVSYLQFFHPEFNLILIVWLMQLLSDTERSLDGMKMYNSRTNYDTLHKWYGGKLDRFIHKWLASFIGITEVMYSRIEAGDKARGDE